VHKAHTGIWMGGAFAMALAVAVATLALRGTGRDGTILGLQLTARWSYCFFLLAYTGGPLTTVFGPTFQPIAKRGRDLGLAFAAAHLAHLSLVVWLYHISSRPPVSTFSAVYFGIAALFTYLIALFSVPRLFAMLPPLLWRLLLTIGMEYIALAFLRDFLQNPFHRGLAALLLYLPFLALSCAALLLRMGAYIKRFAASRRRRHTVAPSAAASTGRSCSGSLR
jgi:hypothetical protein